MKKIFTFFVLIAIMMACEKRQPIDKARKDRLMKFAHDAPLEFYCYLDEHLSSSLKDSICAMKEELYVQLVFSIRDSELDTVEFVRSGLFNDKGYAVGSVKEFPALTSVVGKLKKDQLKPFRDVTYGDYVIGIEFRRFCRTKYEDM